MLITNSFPLKELIASDILGSVSSLARRGGLWNCSRVTGPCCPGPMISLSCSSISFHRRQPISSRLKPNFREFHFPTHFVNRWALPLRCVP
jgi:hypothetical protein